MQNQTLPYLNLQNFLTTYSFQVPCYQRWYEWEERQCEDLWKDIQGILPDISSYHVLGLATAHSRSHPRDLRTEEQVKVSEVDIVDGQQRITTLLILLTVIYRKGGSKMEDLRRIIHPRFRNTPGENIRRLVLNDENLNDYFHRFIITNQNLLDLGSNNTTEAELASKLTLSHERLFKAARYFVEKIATIEGLDLLDLMNCIIQRLYIAVNTYDASADPTLVFSIVNDRGKSLTELEKFKNILIHLIHRRLTAPGGEANGIGHYWSPTDLQEKLIDAYGLIMKVLGSANSDGLHPIDEDNFLRDLWIIQCSPLGTNIIDSTNRFREMICNRIDSGFLGEAQDVVSYLVEFGLENGITAYRDIYFPNESNSFSVVPSQFQVEIKMWITRFHNMDHFTTVIPILMAAYIRNATTMDERQREDLWKTVLYIFKKYEAFVFYRKVIRNSEPSPKRPCEAHDIARKLLFGSLEQAEFNPYLTTLYRKCDTDVYAELTEKHLDNVGRFKYIFYELEVQLRGNNLCDMPNFKDLEVEHILPKAPEVGTWEFISEDDRDQLKNNLGNLFILEPHLNRKISNKPLQYKIQEGYSHSTLRILRPQKRSQLFGDNNYTWDSDKILGRFRELLRWIDERWDLLLDTNAETVCFYHRYQKKSDRCKDSCEVRQKFTQYHPSDLKEFRRFTTAMGALYGLSPSQCKNKILEFIIRQSDNVDTEVEPTDTLKKTLESVRAWIRETAAETNRSTRSRQQNNGELPQLSQTTPNKRKRQENGEQTPKKKRFKLKEVRCGDKTFEFLQNAADSSSLFRAISQALNDGNEAKHGLYRARAVTYIADNRQKYGDIDDDYLINMLSDHAPRGEVVIEALSQHFLCEIRVLDAASDEIGQKTRFTIADVDSQCSLTSIDHVITLLRIDDQTFYLLKMK